MQSTLKCNIQTDLTAGFLDSQHLSFDVLVIECKAQLALQGWTVIKNVPEDDRVKAVLKELGELLPQYTGDLTYEVKALPGFEKYQYSQSANTIQPHTEAPVYTPPPKYLALHCRRQATCGSGHTLLADGFRFIQGLPAELRALATQKLVNFSGFRTPENGADKAPSSSSPILSLGPDGAPILRFSYNVFRYDNLHPTLGMVSRQEFHATDSFFRSMCEQASSFFAAENVAVLIPDGGILIFDNQRMLHARSAYRDPARHLTRYWVGRADSVVAVGVEE